MSAARLQYISIPNLIAEVGGDPWAVNNSLQAGRPAQVLDLARSFREAGEWAAAAHVSFDEARRRLAASWTECPGTHQVIESLQAHSLELARVGADLDKVATTLARTQRAGAAMISAVETHLRRLDCEVATTPDFGGHISDLERNAVDGTKTLLSQLYSLRDSYASWLQEALTTLASQPGALDETVSLPILSTGAEDANSWWRSLSQEQRDRLIAAHPTELGNLNGIPVDVRNHINRAVMNDDLHRPAGAPMAIIRYNNAIRARDGLAASASAKDPQGNPTEVFLLTYRPEAFGGAGSAAIAIGDPDTAPNTAVLVDGAGSGVRAGTLADIDGVRVYEESNRADWARETAVVVWAGYDAPNAVFDPNMYEPRAARNGGRLLAADVNAMAVTHRGSPTHMTVVGHSYGSTVVSDAATYGMRANDVVLVGSPGTDRAHSAADLHLMPGGHLYVGAASGDVVTWSPGQVRPGLLWPSVGGLGDDPAADGFGSTRFKAEVPGNSVNPVYDHLHYFDDGSESLFAIADVVSGHGDALQHDGMTARHRGEFPMGEGFDPEALRHATTGRRHRGPTG